MNDIFRDYIERHKGEEDCVALVCASYRPVYHKRYGKWLHDSRINTELATYGDALLRFALLSLFLDRADELQLSEHIKPYLTDEFLIEHVAKHYRLLDYMLFDRSNRSIPKAYVFYKNNRTKYIATTVEAILGSIYLEDRDMQAILTLVESWTRL